MGTPNNFPVKSFNTNNTPVVAGGAASTGGYVSGSPASLAASASTNVLFDLGYDWDQYSLIVVSFNPVGPSSGLSNVACYSSPDTSLSGVADVRLFIANSTPIGTAFFASITTANGQTSSAMRPCGRYLFISITNADAVNALGATTFVNVACYPS